MLRSMAALRAGCLSRVASRAYRRSADSGMPAPMAQRNETRLKTARRAGKAAKMREAA